MAVSHVLFSSWSYVFIYTHIYAPSAPPLNDPMERRGKGRVVSAAVRPGEDGTGWKVGVGIGAAAGGDPGQTDGGWDHGHAEE